MNKLTITFGEAEKGTRDLLAELQHELARSGSASRPAPADDPDRVCRRCGNWEGDDQDTEAPCAKVGGNVEAGATCDLFGDETNEPPPGGASDEETDEHQPE